MNDPTVFRRDCFKPNCATTLFNQRDSAIAVATELMADGGMPVDGTDVRVAITKLTDEMPSPEDTDRVERRLAAVGWPVNDAFGNSE